MQAGTPSQRFELVLSKVNCAQTRCALESARRSVLLACTRHPLAYDACLCGKPPSERECKDAVLAMHRAAKWEDVREAAFNAICSFEPVCLIGVRMLEHLLCDTSMGNDVRVCVNESTRIVATPSSIK